MSSIEQNFINGVRVESSSNRFADIYNPATGKVIRKTPLSTSDEVEAAIDAATAAFPAWAATPPSKRAQIMFAFREKLLTHQDELAELLSREHGKTLPDAKGEIARGTEVVEFVCGIPHLLKGEYSEAVASNVDSFSVRQPAFAKVRSSISNLAAMFGGGISCAQLF